MCNSALKAKLRRDKAEADRTKCKCGHEIYKVKGTKYWYHADTENHWCDVPFCQTPATPESESTISPEAAPGVEQIPLPSQRDDAYATASRFINCVNRERRYLLDSWKDELAEFIRQHDKRMAAPLREQIERLTNDIDGALIDERDRAEEWSDKLANAIAAHFRVEIGEHSNANNPWQNALDILNGEYVTDEDEKRRAESAESRVAALEQKLRDAGDALAKYGSHLRYCSAPEDPENGCACGLRKISQDIEAALLPATQEKNDDK